MGRGGELSGGQVTTVKGALRDPKRMVKERVYEAGGQKILADKTLWMAMESHVWKKAERMGMSDPIQYYYKPERWIPVARWFDLLDPGAVNYLMESMQPGVWRDFHGRVVDAGGEGTNGEVLALFRITVDGPLLP